MMLVFYLVGEKIVCVIRIKRTCNYCKRIARQKSTTFNPNNTLTGVFFKFGVEESIVNALYGLRITDQLFKTHAFTIAVRSQSTLQRQLRHQI
jgi:hypothetical protein